MARRCTLASWLVAVACESAAATPPPHETPQWIAVAGMEACAVERLVSASDAFATPWEPCGPGCRMRPAVPPGLPDHVAERSASAAQAVDGRLYLRTSLVGPDVRYEIVERSDVAAPELVLRMSRSCHVSGAKADAALLIEVFREPAAHLVAVYSPASGGLAVHAKSFDVALPLVGWYADGGAWGFVDAEGVHRAEGGELERIASASDWLLSPRAAGGAVAWIDWGTQPARVVQWPSGGRAVAGDVAAFAGIGETIALLEVDGADARGGSYESARLRWPEGELDVTGQVASTARIAIDEHHVGLTTPGDGAAIAPAFFRIGRDSSELERWSPPAGHHCDLAGAAGGRWLLQEVDLSRAQRLERWIEHSTPSLASSAGRNDREPSRGHAPIRTAVE
jgi:hypothetical protein